MLWSVRGLGETRGSLVRHFRGRREAMGIVWCEKLTVSRREKGRFWGSAATDMVGWLQIRGRHKSLAVCLMQTRQCNYLGRQIEPNSRYFRRLFNV